MDDLARLLVARVVYLGSLVGREDAEGLGSDGWIEGGHLNRDNQAVASEERHVPGDPGDKERIVLLTHRQHMQVQERALQNLVKERVEFGRRYRRP